MMNALHPLDAGSSSAATPPFALVVQKPIDSRPRRWHTGPTMKHSATHRGSCQVCGRLHKVDARYGTLAKHGYTTEYGFFNGTCMGSGALPYEKSRDLIEASIVRAGDIAASLRTSIGALMVPAKEPKAWVRIYDGTLGYHWIHTAIIAVANVVGDRTYFTYRCEDPRGRSHRVENYSNRSHLELCTELNGQRAAYLRRELSEVECYISSQKLRFESWLPDQPLIPINPTK